MADYVWMEILIVCTVVALVGRDVPWRSLVRRQVVLAFLGLSLLWFMIDYLAVYFGLWSFPQGATLPVRVLGIPAEEYALFFIHTFVVALTLLLLRRLRRS